MRKTTNPIFLALLGATLTACGGASNEARTAANAAPTPVSASGEAVTRKTSSLYADALENLYKYDLENDWSKGHCHSVASAFEGANAEQGGKLSEAIFNAGLAHQRCGEEVEAVAHFRQSLAMNPKAHYARVQVALDDYKKTGKQIGRASCRERV